MSVDGENMQAQPVLGASPYNVAIGLARLGVSTSFFGGLSSDVFGAAIRSRLIAEGVGVARAGEMDRLNTISVVGTEADGRPAYAFHGEGKADRSISVVDLPRELDKNIRAVVMGSYTLAVEPVASAHLADVLAFAVTAAATTCSRGGADPPRLAEMPPDPAAVGAVR